ncbi:MAG: sugar phosphate isomerase/epimerase [Anaerolineae bacterium]
MIKVGIAPDSWGIWFPNDSKQMPWQRCLDEMAEAGYKWIELGPYGYLPTDAGTVRRELDQRGLVAVGQTIDEFVLEDPNAWHEIVKTVMASGALLAELGAPYFVLIDAPYSNLATGETLAPSTLDESGWRRLIDTTHRVADLLHEQFGVKLLFHPHAETHVEYEAQIEKFLQDTDPARVGICFDTGHHAYRGGDAVAFMRKHHNRIPFLHLKSVDRNVQRRVEADKIPFAQAVSIDMFVEPSAGAIDFAAFRDVLRDIHYDGYAIVEQDMYPAPFDKPLPIAKRTREYLREIGVG